MTTHPPHCYAVHIEQHTTTKVHTMNTTMNTLRPAAITADEARAALTTLARAALWFLYVCAVGAVTLGRVAGAMYRNPAKYQCLVDTTVTEVYTTGVQVASMTLSTGGELATRAASEYRGLRRLPHRLYRLADKLSNHAATVSIDTAIRCRAYESATRPVIAKFTAVRYAYLKFTHRVTGTV